MDIIIQNEKAHRLLKKAVTLNSEDYKSLFELGCDYKDFKENNKRTKLDSAYIYLDRARHFALKAKDQEYLRAINYRIVNLKKPHGYNE